MTDQDSDVELIESLNTSAASKKLLKTFPKVILRRMSEQEWIKVAKTELKEEKVEEEEEEEEEEQKGNGEATAEQGEVDEVFDSNRHSMVARPEGNRTEAGGTEKERRKIDQKEVGERERKRTAAQRMEEGGVEGGGMKTSRMEMSQFERRRADINRVEKGTAAEGSVNEDRMELGKTKDNRMKDKTMEERRTESGKTEGRTAAVNKTGDNRMIVNRIEECGPEEEMTEEIRRRGRGAETGRMKEGMVEVGNTDQGSVGAVGLEAVRTEGGGIEAVRMEMVRSETERLETENVEAVGTVAGRLETDKIEAVGAAAGRLEVEKNRTESDWAEAVDTSDNIRRPSIGTSPSSHVEPGEPSNARSDVRPENQDFDVRAREYWKSMERNSDAFMNAVVELNKGTNAVSHTVEKGLFDANGPEISLIKELPPLLHQNQLKRDPMSVPQDIDEIMGEIPSSLKNIYIIDSSQSKQHSKPAKDSKISQYNGYNIIDSSSSLSVAPQAVRKPSSFMNNKDCLKIQSKLALKKRNSMLETQEPPTTTVDVKPELSPKYVDKATSMDECPTVSSSSGESSNANNTASIGIQVEEDLIVEAVISKPPEKVRESSIIKRTIGSQTSIEAFIEVLEPECMYMTDRDEKKLLFLREMELAYYKEYMKIKSRIRELESSAVDHSDKRSDRSRDTPSPSTPRSSIVIHHRHSNTEFPPNETVEQPRKGFAARGSFNEQSPPPMQITHLHLKTRPTITTNLFPHSAYQTAPINGSATNHSPVGTMPNLSSHMHVSQSGAGPLVPPFPPPSYTMSMAASFQTKDSTLVQANNQVQMQREEQAQESLAKALHLKEKAVPVMTVQHQPSTRGKKHAGIGMKRSTSFLPPTAPTNTTLAPVSSLPNFPSSKEAFHQQVPRYIPSAATRESAARAIIKPFYAGPMVSPQTSPTVSVSVRPPQQPAPFPVISASGSQPNSALHHNFYGSSSLGDNNNNKLNANFTSNSNAINQYTSNGYRPNSMENNHSVYNDNGEHGKIYYNNSNNNDGNVNNFNSISNRDNSNVNSSVINSLNKNLINNNNNNNNNNCSKRSNEETDRTLRAKRQKRMLRDRAPGGAAGVGAGGGGATGGGAREVGGGAGATAVLGATATGSGKHGEKERKGSAKEAEEEEESNCARCSKLAEYACSRCRQVS